MISLSAQQNIFLAVQAIDFRKGLNSLVAFCQQHLHHDPFSGSVFIFSNRRRTSVKLLVYDGNGFWLCQKRFSEGKLQWWPNTHEETTMLRASELHILLAQGVPENAALPEDWRVLSQAPISRPGLHNSMATTG